MADRDEITLFCDDLLEPGRFEPIEYGPNGLQVPGSDGVSKIASCVSANLASIEAAVEAGADLILAHHGIFWKFQSRALSEQTTERIRRLLDARVSLLAYHLPLDAHATVGNNSLLCRELGFDLGEAFGFDGGVSIGWAGTCSQPMSTDELSKRIEDLLGRAPLLQGREEGAVSEVGFVSGGGSSYIYEAIERGFDAMITGEPSEYAMATALEGDLAFYAAGHYATETLGVRALGDLISERFGVEHLFIDVPNPV